MMDDKKVIKGDKKVTKTEICRFSDCCGSGWRR